MSEPVTITCRECGEPSRIHFMEPFHSNLVRKSLCHTCNHWLEWVDRAAAGDANIARIKGGHYHIAPDLPKGSRAFAGFGGTETRIEFDDGRRVVTHNLWFQGLIPDRFRDRLPDNARFVTEPWPEDRSTFV